MNFLTSVLHLIGSGATAYMTARNLRDPLTRPNTLAMFQLTESGSVPFLETLKARAEAEGDTWLCEQLTRHAADEKRHGQIFAHALKQLGKQVIDFKQQRQENQFKSNKKSPFFEAYFQGYAPEELKGDRIDWIVFMGSTYILELDASKDFLRMARVLPDNDLSSRSLKKGILSIAQDETRHAAYLYEALQRRLSSSVVEVTIEEWRTRKVNALIAMIGNLLQKGGQTTSFVTDSIPSDNEMELPEVA